LRAWLWQRSGDMLEATRKASGAGTVLAFGLMGLGLFSALSGGGIGGAWLVLIGFFVLNASRGAYQRLLVQDSLKGRRVAELMTPGETNDGRHMATLSARNPVTHTPQVKKDMVRVVTLDAFLDENFDRTRRLDLLKIDVEGFENSVLTGGIRRIADDHPVIIAEIEARHNPDYAEFFDTLAGLGYTCHGYKSGLYVPFTAAEAGAQEAPDHFVGEANHRMDGYVNNFIFQHPNSAAKVLPQ
jgi:hypothetical protein